MKENEKILLIKEFYGMISPLLTFISCEETVRIEDNVLELLCQSKGCASWFDDCRERVESARFLQTATDGALFSASDSEERSVAHDIKMDALTLHKIEKLRNFEEATFVQALKKTASLGLIGACKLLGALYWLGLLLPQNRATAQAVWKTLAMSGDETAAGLLIYSYAQTDDKASQTEWEHVCAIRRQEAEDFSSVARYCRYPQYTKEEVQRCNLITFLSQKACKDMHLTLPMLYYAIHSTDDYKTKMRRLNEDSNYYLLMNAEEEDSSRPGIGYRL